MRLIHISSFASKEILHVKDNLLKQKKHLTAQISYSHLSIYVGTFTTDNPIVQLATKTAAAVGLQAQEDEIIQTLRWQELGPQRLLKGSRRPSQSAGGALRYANESQRAYCCNKPF